MTRFIGGPFSHQKIQDRLDTEIELACKHNVQYWPLFLLEKQEHVGCTGIRPYRIEDLVYELGVHLRQPYWDQGLAEEAARAVIKFASTKSGRRPSSPAITLQILPRNAFSQNSVFVSHTKRRGAI